MGLRHACRSRESLGKRLLFLLDNTALVLGASNCSGSAPNLNHTCREVCVISLSTFTIPVCRWIASEDNPADEPSRSKRYRPGMHDDVDQCGTLRRGQPLTRNSLPSSLKKPRELPVKKQRLENSQRTAPALVSPVKVEEGWDRVRVRRVQRGLARTKAHAAARNLANQHSLFGESSFLEQNRVTAATVQRYTVALDEFLNFAKLPLNELQVVKNLDGVVVEMLDHLYFQGYGHGSGEFLTAAIKFVGWIQNFAGLPRAMRALKGYRRCPRKVSGATAMGSGGCNDGNGNGGERRGVRCDARSPVCGVSASKRTVQFDNGSNHPTALGLGNRS